MCIRDRFNQVSSNRMDAYFIDGNIDSVRARGSAECVYYIQDEDSAFTGINQSNAELMDVYFKEKELQRVVFRTAVKGTIWPMKPLSLIHISEPTRQAEISYAVF